MGHKIFRNIFAILFMMAIFSTSTFATKTPQTQTPKKPKLVLMPIKVSEEDRSLSGAMETALVEGLQELYVVFSGERVQQKTREIFSKESKTAKAECDETKCMEDIALAFQAELIAVANVTKRDGGYFLAISIQNIFDNKVVYSKSLPCKNSDSFDVIEKLKELSGMKVVAETQLEQLPIHNVNAQVKVNADSESVLWTEVQLSNTEDDYNVYLESYPKGKFTALAKSRLKKIKDSLKEAAQIKEQQDWGYAQKENSEIGYSKYVEAYPQGTFVSLAASRMNNLKNDLLEKNKIKEQAVLRDKLELEEKQKQWRENLKTEPPIVIEKMVSAYKIGGYVDVQTAKIRLASVGLEVVGTFKSTENSTTILYTNAEMKAAANKSGRGFAAVGRLLIDDERKQVHIANPIYFNKAFLQDDYNHPVASMIYRSLEKAFGPLKNTEDEWEFSKLNKYHFMIGMPYYEDMTIVSKSSNTDLVTKAKMANGTVVELEGNSYLAFVELDSRTSSFIKKIGTDKSELLPWAVLIEDGEAKALKAEYLIGLSYPLIDLNGFAKIMTAPDAVIKSLKNTFK